jgi:hypothetical protein
MRRLSRYCRLRSEEIRLYILIYTAGHGIVIGLLFAYLVCVAVSVMMYFWEFKLVLGYCKFTAMILRFVLKIELL